MDGVLVGINKTPNGEEQYRVITYTRSDSEGWKFNRHEVPGGALIEAIKNNNLTISNVKLVSENGKVKIVGNGGDLSRFDAEGFHPMVVISEMVADGVIIGYKLATFDGVVTNVRLKDVYAYCNRVKGHGAPLQNAIYVSEQSGRQQFIKAYPGQKFITETISRQRSKDAAPAKPTTRDNESKISKMEELFTKDQINELMLGKKQGVDIRIFGNNKLSAAQMKEIRKGLADKINASLFADPSFSVDAMKAYRIQAKYGVKIKDFINPAYNAQQIMELSTGYLSGVNYAEYADPKLTADDMAKHRIYLESKLWMTVEADKQED